MWPKKKIKQVVMTQMEPKQKSTKLQTSTLSLLCMPKIDPIRCDKGWLPKSLLTYLQIKKDAHTVNQK